MENIEDPEQTKQNLKTAEEEPHAVPEGSDLP